MYRNILIPVIFDEGHDARPSFQAAVALASDGAHFVVMHVMEDIPAYVASQIPQDVRDATRSELQSALLALSEGLPGAEAILSHGHAGSAILDYAHKNDIDCIVMASHKPGWGDMLLGSTADRVVRHAKCSVHVVR